MQDAAIGSRHEHMRIAHGRRQTGEEPGVIIILADVDFQQDEMCVQLPANLLVAVEEAIQHVAPGTWVAVRNPAGHTQSIDQPEEQLRERCVAPSASQYTADAQTSFFPLRLSLTEDDSAYKAATA